MRPGADRTYVLAPVRASLVAIGRARVAILTIAATYVISLSIGIAMVSAGNTFALQRRDEIVGSAQSSQILVARREGEHLRAALLDFASNVMVGAVPSTLAGFGVVVSYPLVAYRGWVGGIVSVDARHQSRLAETDEALYYVVTLVLQLIPYSIAGGVGVRLGVDLWRTVRRPRTDTWLGVPKDGLRDVALAYVLIVPLFLVASLWEFLIR